MMAKVDADLIKQAILNIVLNGAQAMEELGGGELTVHMREEAEWLFSTSWIRGRVSRMTSETRSLISTSRPKKKAAA